jgi:Leucine rich repeat
LNSLVTCQEGVYFQCKFRIVSWTLIGNQYGCDPTVTIKNRGNVLVEVSGSHMTGKSNSDVKILDVWSQKSLLQMPKNIESFFPNLIGIEFANGNISSISVDDLKAFPNLKVLSFGYNLLTSLDGNLFIQNPKLQWISFSDNKITNVGYNLLSGLNELDQVYFNDNPCVNKVATTPFELSELKSFLRTSCPPLVSTQTPMTTTMLPTTQCPSGCLERIETLQNGFEAENLELREKVAELNGETMNLYQVVAVYEERLTELERQIREINSNPRSP